MTKQTKEIGDGQPLHPTWNVVKKSFSVRKDVYAELVNEQARQIKDLGVSYSLSEIVDQLLRPILLPKAAKSKTRKKKRKKRRK